MRIRSSWLAAGLMLVACTLGRAQEVAASAEVDAYVAQIMARYGITGVSLAVMSGERVVHQRAYGLASVELAVPTSDATLYQLSSTTKLFSGTAAMVLVQDGVLALDKPVATYLEGLPAAWSGITVRHLLSHQSGLPEVLDCPTDHYDQALACVRELPVLDPPGTRFRYIQTNYLLVKAIIEKLSGKSFLDFVQERLFQPAGMNHTVYAGSVLQVVPGRATSYYPDGKGGLVLRDFKFPEILLTAAGLNSSTADLVLWTKALLGNKLLNAQHRAELWRTTPFNDGKPASYALGWDYQTHNADIHSVGHSGGGLTTYRHFLEPNLTVVLLTNGTRYRFSPDQFAIEVAAKFEPKIRSPVAQLTEAMFQKLDAQDQAGALALYEAFIHGLGRELSTEDALNGLGYDLLSMNRIAQAVAILELNVQRYPESGNAHDSLGEAYLKQGNKELARKHYSRSLELNPNNDNAKQVLAGMGAAQGN